MRVTIQKARIEHMCHGCLEKITPGSMYERTETLDGRPRKALCMRCRHHNTKLTEVI